MVCAYFVSWTMAVGQQATRVTGKGTARTKRTPMKNLLATASCMAGMVANATPITFSGSSGNLAAEATFDVNGTSLVVTLVNTSTTDPKYATDILTGVIFNVAGSPNLNKDTGSAVLGSGSSVFHGPTPSTDAGGVIGGEWGFVDNAAQYGASYAIYAAGYFSGTARFPGSNLQGPDSVDGLQYGITTLSDTQANDAPGNNMDQGLVKNSVAFTLPGLPSGFDPSLSISDVTFQYGTALGEGHFSGDPVPDGGTTAALLGVGLVGIGFLARRKA